MTTLDPPPTGQTFNFRVFKDWFYKIWKRIISIGPFGVTGTNPSDGGYSAAIAMSSGLLGVEPGGMNFIQPQNFYTNSTSSAVSISNGTTAAVGNISLPPGLWDVYGMVAFNTGTATGITALATCNSTTSASFSGAQEILLQATFATGEQILPVASTRYTLTAQTTIYFNCVANFTGGTATAAAVMQAKPVTYPG